MKQLVLSIFCITYSFAILYGQPTTKESYSWSCHTNAGYAFPISRMKTGFITDHLIEYEDDGAYWQFVTLNFFLARPFGVTISVQGDFFTTQQKRQQSLYSAILNIYGNEYFLTEEPVYFEKIANVSLFAGLIYQADFKRIYFAPKVQIGIKSFSNTSESVFLKKNGANSYLNIHFMIMIGMFNKIISRY